MIITKTEKELIIDGRNKTIIHLTKGKDKIDFIGFDNNEQITLTNFVIIFEDSDNFFGKEVMINNKTYKYIGVDETKKEHTTLWWDVAQKCIMFAN